MLSHSSGPELKAFTLGEPASNLLSALGKQQPTFISAQKNTPAFCLGVLEGRHQVTLPAVSCYELAQLAGLIPGKYASKSNPRQGGMEPK